MTLRCTTCHAQLVQGLHLTVHETNCFICHFYRAGLRGEEECSSCAVGGCTSCYIEPKGDIKVKGWNFNHRKYIARGVACEKCHLSVVQGDGHVPEGKCVECHNEPVILSTKYTSQVMHKKHVTDHKIECSKCHTPLRHEIGSILTTKYAEKAIGEACVDCHGEGYDETLKHWKVLLSKAENESNQRIFNVQKVLYNFEKTRGGAADFKKAQNLLNEARNNYSFVLLGKGVHNIEYSFKLLNAANNKTR